MNKEIIIKGLKQFRIRLTSEVLGAYEENAAFGRERLTAWRRSFTKFLDDHLPQESDVLNHKLTHIVAYVKHGESDAQNFMRMDGHNMMAYIDSLILDIQSDEYHFREKERNENMTPSQQKALPKDKVFIVHGHDGEAKEKTARFIEKLKFEAVILHEQPSEGMTIIEKIEKYSSEVGFGIVLYTPDDLGNAKDKAQGKGATLNKRARQNVVFEHGVLIGKIGRKNVTTLADGEIELPNDISGVVYISDSNWQVDIAKEMKAAGYEINLNEIM